MKAYLDLLREKIAQGETVDAADRLSDLLESSQPDLDSAVILLKSRKINLDRAVRDGVIAREDETVERNAIARSLLQVIQEIDRLPAEPLAAIAARVPQSIVVERAAEPHFIQKGLKNRSRQLTSIVVMSTAVLALIFFWSRRSSEKTLPPSPLTVKLRIESPPKPGWSPQGAAKAWAGDAASEPQPIELPETTLKIDGADLDARRRPLRLAFENLNLPLEIVSKSAENFAKTDLIEVSARIAAKTFEGKIVHSDGQPAAGIDIWLENGLGAAQTDREGRFSLLFPALDRPAVRLALRRGATVLVDRQVGLDEAVFKELKLPPAR